MNMIAVIGDTHGTDHHRLEGRTLQAVRKADHVFHTGDFTTEAVYDAVSAEAGQDTGGAPVTAVHGNRDEHALAGRLPETATAEADGLRLVVAHGHRRDRTNIGLLAREAQADVAIVGHSHRPGIEELPAALLVNPGSYADPRQYRAAHAEIHDGTRVEIRTPGGTLLTEQEI